MAEVRQAGFCTVGTTLILDSKCGCGNIEKVATFSSSFHHIKHFTNHQARTINHETILLTFQSVDLAEQVLNTQGLH